MCSRMLTSSSSAEANSLLPVYQFDFQSWMTPTRIPPGWIFWPISDHLREIRLRMAAKSKRRKDAGSARSQRLRARLSTRRGAALQPSGAREGLERGSPTLALGLLFLLAGRLGLRRGGPAALRLLVRLLLFRQGNL